LLSALIGAPLLVALYGVMRTFPQTWWLWAAAGYSLVSVVLTTLAPVVLMPLFFKFEPLQQEQQVLVDRLRRLARRAGTRIQGVYSFDMSRRTRAANAALVGLGKTRRILLGDTLVDEFTTDEIETIMAHELAHHVHNDVPLGLFVGTALEFATFFLAAQFLQIIANRLPFDSLADPAGLPFLGLFFGMTGLISLPLGNAYSRWREAMADDYALKVTNKPRHFASAFTRLANQNLAEADPSRWVRWLLASHPPLKERIAKAKRFAQSTSKAPVEETTG
jgi:STE24 endopeptidase